MLLTLSSLITECQYHTKDTTTATLNDAIRRMNDIQSAICASKDYYWLESTYSTVTVASQASYDFPVDSRLIKTATVTQGTTAYPLIEIIDPFEYNLLNNNTTFKTNIPTHFHIRNKKLFIYPTPTTASLPINLLYIKRPRSMSKVDYAIGTLAVTNGSTAVVGSGTTFTNNTKAGTRIQIVDDWYEIASITNATNLVLTMPYQGTTATGLSYTAGDAPIIPEDFQSILWKTFVEEYYARKEEPRTLSTYTTMRLEVEKRLQDSTSTKSATGVWNLNNTPRITLNPNYNSVLS